MAEWISRFAVPLFIAVVLFVALFRKVPVFDEFLTGASEGLQSSLKIIPALVALMTAVAMLRASGLLELLTAAAAPVADFLGIPAEIVPLALLRPVSGSGSLAMLESIYSEHGADSLVGRVASVLQSSTETTFYTIAVYYGSVKIKQTRHTLIATTGGDLVSIVLSALAVRMLLN